MLNKWERNKLTNKQTKKIKILETAAAAVAATIVTFSKSIYIFIKKNTNILVMALFLTPLKIIEKQKKTSSVNI